MRVRAHLELLSTEQSGRTSPIRSDYRPNHNFGAADDRVFYIGRIMLTDRDELRPGEAGEVTIDFLETEGLALAPGRAWRIQEGWRLVARATVIAVLP